MFISYKSSRFQSNTFFLLYWKGFYLLKSIKYQPDDRRHAYNTFYSKVLTTFISKRPKNVSNNTAGFIELKEEKNKNANMVRKLIKYKI